ncbi:MAG: VTC domain-containing protein [Elusimicrobiota bacterium]|nr:VTC domain-containing protein [Elusimicrobiota bacterium]
MQTMTSEATLEEILGMNVDLPVNAKPQARENPAVQEEFQSIKDEVLLSRKQAGLLLEEVNRCMKPSPLQKGALFTLIASHYFDSPELAFFRQHSLQAPKRYKLRINRYAPDGAWNEEAPVIELKSDENGVSRKRRFALTQDNYERVTTGKTLKMTDELLALNPEADRENLLIWLITINGFIVEHRLKPALKLQYRRLAFEAADRFRLTMDTDLKIDALDIDVARVAGTRAIAGKVWDEAERVASEYESGRHCVVRLNHTGRIPQWVESFLKRHEIENTSFSKYCWAVNETAGPGTSIPEAIDGQFAAALD